jgi:ATP-dependent RNA helicase RhlE
MDFHSFNLHPHVASGITAAGFITPTPIQIKAIPPVMQGRDVMGLAQTGTGKTAAFALPILHRLKQGPRGRTRSLIIAPTRELAEQIHEAIQTLGRQTRLRSVTVYGGVGINPQVSNLKRGADIVVACPGRLLDHIGRRTIDLSSLEVLVLDEADHMFDMGFLPDIRRILSHLPAKRQTLMFSATMPTEIRRLAGDVLDHPVTVQIGATAPADTVSHALYPVEQHRKTAMLMELLRHTETRSVLVFTRTKHRAKNLGEKLGRIGFKATSLQGNLSQRQRQAALNGFRNGTFQILVATDVAARGIDVTRVSHVINFDIPDTADAYIHRIGRTGRASRNGDAFTLVTGEDKAMVRAIEQILGGRMEHRTIAGFNDAMPTHRNHTGSAAKPLNKRDVRPKPSKATSFGKHKRTAAGSNRKTRKAYTQNRQDAARTAYASPNQAPEGKRSCPADRGGPFCLECS